MVRTTTMGDIKSVFVLGAIWAKPLYSLKLCARACACVTPSALLTQKRHFMYGRSPLCARKKNKHPPVAHRKINPEHHRKTQAAT